MESKMEQFQYETNTWKRSLGLMIEENIHLKNRLTEILKNGFDKKLLEYLEYFQNRFIKEDERIGLIRHDIASIDKIIQDEFWGDHQIVKETNKKMSMLRNIMLHAEKQFNELKLEFDNYILKMFNTKNNIAAA
jgi:glutaredoxin 2